MSHSHDAVAVYSSRPVLLWLHGGGMVGSFGVGRFGRFVGALVQQAEQ